MLDCTQLHHRYQQWQSMSQIMGLQGQPVLFQWNANPYHQGKLRTCSAGIAMGMSKESRRCLSVLMCYPVLRVLQQMVELSSKLVKVTSKQQQALYGSKMGCIHPAGLPASVTDMGVFWNDHHVSLPGYITDTVTRNSKICHHTTATASWFVLMIPVTAVLGIGVTYKGPTLQNGISALPAGFMSTAGAPGSLATVFVTASRFYRLHHLICPRSVQRRRPVLINNEKCWSCKPIFRAFGDQPRRDA